MLFDHYCPTQRQPNRPSAYSYTNVHFCCECRANLLAHLHRLKTDSYQIDQKQIIKAVGYCLKKKDDFGREVVKETLLSLAKDDKLSDIIIRTAIIGFTNFPELKPFIFAEWIPSVIRKLSWKDTVKKSVFDGLVLLLKNHSTHAAAKEMLKCFLSLPLTRLSEATTSAPEASKSLLELFASMSSSEKTSILSGVYVGLTLDEEEVSNKEMLVTNLQPAV